MRLYVYAAVTLAVIALGWYAKHQGDRADAAIARAESAEASITALRAAHAHEQRIAKEASDGYQKDLARLAGERNRKLSVRVCKPAAGAVPAAAAAAPGSDGSGAGRERGEVEEDRGRDERDIGAELLEYGIACEATGLQLTRLQEWVRAR